MRISTLAIFFIPAMIAWGQPPAPPPVRSGHSLASPGGKWWDKAEIVKRLEITPEQQKKMDDVFQQSRLRLIDLRAALQKEEVVMEDLMKGPQLDDAKILPAVDRIAQARAELEKADARLLLALRHVLTPEQWQKLNAETPPPHHPGPPPPRPGPPPPVREE